MPKVIVDTDKKEYRLLIVCKQCIYYRENYNDWDVCSLYDKPRFENDFCSRAIRNEKYDDKNRKI